MKCSTLWGIKKRGGVESGGSDGGGVAGVSREGERANARSVTPHCAHLPTHPTPKFELGSQPRRFSSTRLPSSLPIPRFVLLRDSSSPIDPPHGKRTGRDVSPLTPSVCVHSVHLRPSSPPSYLRRAINGSERPPERVPCRSPAGIDINVINDSPLSRSLSLDNQH